MLAFEKAFEIVLDAAVRLDSTGSPQAHLLGTEQVDISCAVNRILAEDVKSDTDIPPFNKAAMDGYACRRSDLANELTIIETLAAGVSPKKVIGPNECAKIMTGAMVPEGADCVIMVEFTENTGGDRVRFIGRETAGNICIKAEDIKAGEVVMRRGTLLRPQHISTLAAVGCAEPCVAVRPRVGVIATGDELVEPSQRPSVAQIRDNNSYQLAAQVEAVGAVARNYGIVKDTREAIDAAIKKAASENDVILISGGVSVGEFDFVPDILRQNGFELMFEKVAIKPGKPTVFGRRENIFCFGVPGNPVSGFVIFELLIKPFLYKLMGHNFRPLEIKAPLGTDISRKKVGSPSWIPVIINGAGMVVPVEYHGSAHFNAICNAEELLCIPKGAAEMNKGTMVSVRII